MIGPTVQHNFDATPVWRYWVARSVLQLWGWDVDPDVPQVPKAVMIAAPHTSNWDAVLMLLAGSVYRVKVRVLIKDTAFTFPVGMLLRSLGAIPTDRSGNLGIVGQAVREIQNAERIVFGVAPSGTRRKVERWKSGFYWIASEAGVPILCGYLDYGNKIAGMGQAVYVSGNVRADMDAIRAAYAGKTGYHPEKQTPIRIKEELSDEQDVGIGEAAPVEPGSASTA